MRAMDKNILSFCEKGDSEGLRDYLSKNEVNVIEHFDIYFKAAIHNNEITSILHEKRGQELFMINNLNWEDFKSIANHENLLEECIKMLETPDKPFRICSGHGSNGK